MKQTDWRGPAVVLAAGSLMLLLSFGIRQSFGLFLPSMTQDLGWGRENFALAIAVQNIVWGIGQPFSGALADRYGSGRVLFFGTIVYVLGVGLMSQTATATGFVLSAGVMVGIGMGGAGFAVVLAVMGRAVSPEQRSLALGLGTAAGSLGQFIMVPLGQAYLSRYGWSTALLLLAATAALMVPLAGVLGGPPAAVVGHSQSLREALAEAVRHPGYWLLTSGYFVCGFQVAFIGTHLPAYLVDRGMGVEIGAWALAIIGLFNVFGSLGAGALGQRRRKKYLLSWIYLGRSIVLYAFIVAPPSEAGALLFAAAIGILWLATVPLTTGLVGQIFGVQYMAMLSGIVFFSHQIGSFLGIWLGGKLYDATGSYDPVWWASIALGLFAALVHWPIDDRTVVRARPVPVS